MDLNVSECSALALAHCAAARIVVKNDMTAVGDVVETHIGGGDSVYARKMAVLRVAVTHRDGNGLLFPLLSAAALSSET